MYEDLKDLVSRLLELFVKPAILEKNKTGKKMMKLDLYDKEILLSAEKINVGFPVESELNYWKKKVNVTAPQIKVFMKGVQRFLCAMVTKLFERSPFGSLVLLSAAMFDPNIPLNTSKQKLAPFSKNLLKHLLELTILCTKQCDVINTEFKFLNVEVKTMQRESVTLSQKDGRLDYFYFKLASFSKYKDLLFAVKFILTLSHGQASVERGFNINANIVKKMSPESLTAKRIIKGHMLANKLKPHTIEITKPIVQAFRSDRQKYEVHLEEEKKKKQTSEAEVRAMHIAADNEKP